MSKSRPISLSIAVALTAFSVYFASFSGTFHSSADEWLMFATTESLAKRGELNIDQLFWVGEYGGLARFGLDGNLYNKFTNFSTGQMLAGLPLYEATRLLPGAGLAQGTLLTNSVVVSALLALLVLTLAELGYSDKAAVATALAFGFASLLWPYAETYFGEPLLGLSFLAVVYCLVRERNRLASGSNLGAGWRREAWVSAAALAIAAAALTKQVGAIVAPFAAGYLLYLRRGDSLWTRLLLLVRLALPTAAVIASLSVLSSAHFGLGQGLLHDNAFTTPIWWGLYGLLLSPGRSVFLYSPVVLLGVIGIRSLWQRDRGIALFLSSFVAAYFCLFAQWNDWHGGPYVWGPRFLVAVTPLFAIPAASLFEASWPRRWRSIALTLVVVVGVSVQIVAVGNNYLPVMLEIQSHYAPPSATDMVARLESFSNLQMVPILLMWQSFSLQQSDVAWLAVGDATAAILSFALVLASLITLALVYRRPRAFSSRLLLASLALLTVAVVAISLPRYAGHSHYGPPEYRMALEEFDRDASPGAALITLGTDAQRAFNYQRAPNRRYGLAAGSLDPWEAEVVRLLEQVIRSHDSVWLLSTDGQVGEAEAWLRERTTLERESHYGNIRLVRLRPNSSE